VLGIRYCGKEVEDISLTFRNGKVIKASAVKGEDLLKEILKVESADRIGEAAIGTNYGITRFTKETLFDEKMGGTIHLALGRSYFESGGLNQSGVHWDILKDMKKDGEIYADEELLQKRQIHNIKKGRVCLNRITQKASVRFVIVWVWDRTLPFLSLTPTSNSLLLS
jgi:leucyl aminopeptidase (aminopeptidase T)